MLICEKFLELYRTDPAAAMRYLIEAQPDPAHVRELLRWTKRFIFCGHVVTAGYSLIGQTFKKDKKTDAYIVDKEKAKIGTHSGYYKGWFASRDKKYYGWQPDVIPSPWTMKDFSPAAIWLMSCPVHIMRELCFQFNCIHFHTNNSTIVDIDSYKGKCPDFTLEFILSKIPPGTPASISQKGGRHFYFRKTAGVVGHPELGIDIIQNGFVFCPPSHINGGGSYRFENVCSPADFPKELPEMPPALVGFFSPPERVKRDTPIIHRETFSPRQIEILEKRLTEAEQSDDRSSGDYAAACWAVKIGMDIEQFKKYALSHSKFEQRGEDYLERTWNAAVSAEGGSGGDTIRRSFVNHTPTDKPVDKSSSVVFTKTKIRKSTGEYVYVDF